MTDTTKTIRTRFAPSPTGFVHIGSLRTALFAFLFARHNGGVNVLRLEDTDQNRLVEGSLENLLKVMGNLGVEFDEGYYVNDAGEIAERGSHGPYVQSKRLDLYNKYVLELIEKKSAYYCFCTTERLDALRKEQVALKKPPMYDRHCRNLSVAEVAAKQAEFTAAGMKPVVRQAIPEDGTTLVKDLIYGDITFDNKNLDDQVLLKSDGFPTYHLAVVVDDHLMEITHVIRGEDWINSTPKHVLLYEAFGWEKTEFAHMPNILNQDKTKLSKRQGDVSVEDFLKKGYLKEALVNFVVFLGWNPKTEQEIFSLQDLIEQFDLAKINRGGAVFDSNKLDWLNSLYIRALSDAELTKRVLPYFEEAGIAVGSFKPEYVEAIVALEKERLKKLSDIVEGTSYFFATPEFDAQLAIWKKSDAATTAKILGELAEYIDGLRDSDFAREVLEEKIKSFIVDKGYDNGSVLWPMRVSLSGLAKSPGPFDIAAVLFVGLGKAEIVARIKKIADKLK